MAIVSLQNNGNNLLLFKDCIQLSPGLTLLGGGNGVGKTTLLGELRLWARSKGYWAADGRMAPLFATEDDLRQRAAKQMRVLVEEDGETRRCLFWQNATDNHRYQKPDFFNPDMGRIDRYYTAGERSEGENVVESLLRWLDEANLSKGDILFLDEVDSGLSVDACNGIICAILESVKKSGCQVLVTCNSWHFPYVCGGMVNLLDGRAVEFNKSYEKFCEFSYRNARRLSAVRERAREKQRKEQERAAAKREADRQRFNTRTGPGKGHRAPLAKR